MVRMAREFLERRGVEAARLEAELLVAHALGLDRLKLFLQLDRPVGGSEIDRARDLLVRRGRREPTAYITGVREFYGRPFKVGPGVLIPRPETELLVDVARGRFAKAAARAPRVADLGTGCGCIAVTLALELPGARVLAVDLSGAAVLCAQANARSLGADLRFVEGEGLAALDLATREDGPFDLVLSNPPYVAREERGTLAPEVAEHEPELALYAPAGDRDFWVRTLLERGRAWLAPGGMLLVELGLGQGAFARTLASDLGWTPRLHPDLAGTDRVLEAVA